MRYRRALSVSYSWSWSQSNPYLWSYP